MEDLTIFAAKYVFFLPLMGIAYVYLQIKDNKTRNQFVALLLVSGAISLLIAQLLKAIIDNPRPFISDGVRPMIDSSRDNGFPSDHTLFSAFLAFCVWQYRKKLGLMMLIIAAIVGWARVAAGVHHTIDIVGSFAITGIVCLVAGHFIRAKFLAKNTTES
jgi:undecaprenyl-diphosphatase